MLLSPFNECRRLHMIRLIIIAVQILFGHIVHVLSVQILWTIANNIRSNVITFETFDQIKNVAIAIDGVSFDADVSKCRQSFEGGR